MLSEVEGRNQIMSQAHFGPFFSHTEPAILLAHFTSFQTSASQCIGLTWVQIEGPSPPCIYLFTCIGRGPKALWQLLTIQTWSDDARRGVKGLTQPRS